MKKKNIEWLAEFTFIDLVIFSFTIAILIVLWMQILYSVIELMKVKKSCMPTGSNILKNELKSIRNSIIAEAILALSFSAAAFMMIFAPDFY